METIVSKVEYKKDLVILDNATKVTYKVLSCEKQADNSYRVELKKHNKHLEQLKDALQKVKLHDKDLFMLENIVSSLEDDINGKQ